MSTKTGAHSERESKPRGRNEVIESLTDAAAELFAVHGPSAVTVRDIAAKAGVNHALLHRHFDSKQRLVRAVLERYAEDFRASIANATSPQQAARALNSSLRDHNAFLRLVAFMILEGASPDEIVVPDGGLERWLKLSSAGTPTEDDRARTVIAAALTLGYALFEPFLMQAVGGGIAPARVQRHLTAAHEAIRVGPTNQKRTPSRTP